MANFVLTAGADTFPAVGQDTSGDDTIDGLGGDDVIAAGSGNDTVQGGSGNDTLNGGDADDVLEGGAGNDTLNGALGVDTASYAGAVAGVTVTLASAAAQNTVGGGVDTLVSIEGLIGSAFDDTLTGDGAGNKLMGGSGADVLIGGLGNDILRGGIGTDVLRGDAGSDNLGGEDGDDVLEGGAGNDTLNGGLGNDTASYAGALAGVTVTLASTTAQNTGGDGVDTLVAIEGLTGSAFNDVLTGDAAANTLNGGAGNDTLNGGAGADTVRGDAGNDTLNGDDADDVLEGGAGNDTLNGGLGVDTASYAGAVAGVTVTLASTSAQNTVGDGVDTLSGIEWLVGSAFNDTLTGDAAGNKLTGGAGNDALNGGLGNDILRGGVGIDVLRGDVGSDNLGGEDGDDVLEGGAGNDLLNGGLGVDTASYAGAAAGVTVTLASTAAQNTGGDGVDTLAAIEGLTGSAFNDTLTGDALANTLAGGAGNDGLSGGDADDLLEGGAGNDTLNGGSGVDTASYARAVAGVTVTLTTAAAQNTGGDGVDTLSSVEALIGSAFDDTLTGNAVANTLTGGAGNDTLNGGLGNDTASYAGAIAGVTVTLLSTAAQNTVGAGVDTLSGIEWLIGSAFDDTLTGDALANSLTGGGGNDVLTAGAGNDSLIAGDGDDVLEGGAGNDILNGGLGNDTASYAGAVAGVTVTLASTSAQNTVGDGVDTLSGVEWLVGSAFNDTLTGDAAGNKLTGGAGNDALNGGLGNDILRGGVGIDVLRGDVGSDNLGGEDGDDVLEGGAGNDLLNGGLGVDTASYAGAVAGVTVTLLSAAAQNTGGDGVDTLVAIEGLTGSAFDDTLTGDAMANKLTGGAGNDTLVGGLGNDILRGGLGIDVLRGDAGSDNLGGEDGDDVLEGGAGNDALNGGLGTDVASYAGAVAGVTVTLASTTAQNTGGDGVDTLVAIEGLTGSAFDDTLTGDAVANTLTGGLGNDTLSGGADADTLTGGDGNDRLDGGAGADAIDGGVGIDAASYASATAGVSVSLLTTAQQDTVGAGLDTLTGVESLIGSEFDDQLTGNIQNNVLSGGGGNDQLLGDDGLDTLSGDAGDDALSGGAGDDTLDGGLGIDTLSGGGGNDLLRGEAGGLTLISLSTAGTQGVGASTHASISADGGYVSFRSLAPNLAPGNPNAGPDIFLRDLNTGVTTRLGEGFWSAVADGGQAVAFQGWSGVVNLWSASTGTSAPIVTGAGSAPGITPDGRYVVVNTSSGTPTVVRYDTTTASVTGTGGSYPGAISHDGRYMVAYQGGSGDLYRYEFGVGSTFIASTARQSDISGTGRYVAFTGDLDTVVSGDDNAGSDVFWKDMQSGEVRRISVSNQGVQADGRSYDASISGNGRFVVFSSDADNLVAGDTNRAADVFLHDTLTGLTTLLSVGAAGQANGSSHRATISNDGLRVSFESEASNLTVGDINGYADVFVLTGDALAGGAGNDVFEVRSALDVVTELANQGFDTVGTALSQYALTDNVENLTFTGVGAFLGRGNASENILTGGAGADILAGRGGADTLIGAGGADTFAFSIVDDAQTDDAFRDTIQDWVSGTDKIRIDYGTVVGDLILANGSADGVLGQLSFDAGAQRLTIQGAAAGSASDVVVGMTGGLNVATDIAIDVRASGGAAVTAFGGDDRIFGGALSNTLLAGGGVDVVWGGEGDDVINGEAGDDVIFGGFGADQLTGGSGADTFKYYLPNAAQGFNDQQGALGSPVRDTITDFQSGADRLVIDFGGQGAPKFIMRDSVAEGNFEFGGMRYDAAAGTLTVQGYGSVAEVDLVINSAEFVDITKDIDVVISMARSDYEQQVVTLGGDDVILMLGTPLLQMQAPGQDFLADGRIGDTVDAGGGDDVVEGGGGDDWIRGAAGADRLQGGSGADSFLYDLATDAQGAGLVRDTLQDFQTGVDHIRIDFGTQGSGFTLVESSQDGLVGAVRYDATTGLFTIQGAGLGTAQDIVIRSVAEILTDDVDEQFSVVEMEDVEVKVALLETSRFAAFAGRDVVTAADASAFDNTFDGAGGDDVLDGGLGDDTLTGADGLDRLTGGDGADTLLGGADDDVLNGGAGADRLSGGAGDDELNGGGGDDVILAGGGKDAISAGDGADIVVVDSMSVGETLALGFGDDVIRFTGSGVLRLGTQNFRDGDGPPVPNDDGDTPFPPDGGALTILLSDADGAVTGARNSGVSLSGNAYSTGLTRGVTVLGNAGDNSIKATEYADTLIGGAGVDRLYGMGGADRLTGGAASDVFGIGNLQSVLSGAGGATFKGVTLQDFEAGDGGDRILVVATATGRLTLSEEVLTISNEDVTYANLATKFGELLGTQFFDFDSPMQGSTALIVQVETGEAAGHYLIADNLGFGFAAYQSNFDTVIRLENYAGGMVEDNIGYIRGANGNNSFSGRSGNLDVIEFANANATTNDGSARLFEEDTSLVDRMSNLNFAGEDVFQFRSSQFEGLTSLTSDQFITAGSADLFAADLNGTVALSTAVSALVVAAAGGPVNGPFFALVEDTDAANGGANASTYLVFDRNGTGSTSTVNDANGDAQADILILARWAGVSAAEIGLDTTDFWFDVDVAPVQDPAAAADFIL